MIVKAGVERHLNDCSVIDYETIRCPLKPQTLRVLLQCFTNGETKQAVKVERGEAYSVCERFQRKILIEVGLDVYKDRQQSFDFVRGSLIPLNAYTHLSCCSGL